MRKERVIAVFWGAVIVYLIGLAFVSPELVFSLVSACSDNIRSPAGWLLAFPAGLLLAFVVASFFVVFGRQGVVAGMVAGGCFVFSRFLLYGKSW